MPKYRTLEKVFIAPYLIPAGTVINYDGPVGAHLEPMDEEAAAKLDAYFQENPHANLSPIDQLEITPVTVSIEAAPTEKELDLTIVDPNAPPAAGLTDGGAPAEDAAPKKK